FSLGIWIISLFYPKLSPMRRLAIKLQSLPVVKPLIERQQIAIACQMMATALASGLSLLQAIQMVQKSQPIKKYQHGFAYLYRSILEGQSLQQSLVRQTWVPDEMRHILTLGERSGNLTKQMQILADYLQQQLEQSIAPKLKLIEPILILVLGIAMASMLLALYLPIFQLGEVF
ncbi:MAG: type II secretion system F family protein, partial [Vibrio sp.]